MTDRAKADIILRHLKSGIIISYHNISFKRFEGKKKIKKVLTNENNSDIIIRSQQEWHEPRKVNSDKNFESTKRNNNLGVTKKSARADEL